MSINVKKVVTGELPFTPDEVKLWLKVDGTDDDTLITSLMSQAVDLAGYWLNISIIKQTITLSTSSTDSIKLPYGIINTITSVKDISGEDIDYVFDGFTITVLATQPFTVVYEAGWDDGEAPEGLVMALKETITYFYENRGDSNLSELIRANPNLQVYNKQSWFK